MTTQKKAVFAAFLFIIFVLSLLGGAYFSRHAIENDTVYRTASPTEKPMTILTLSPASLSLTKGQKQTVTLSLSNVPVTAIDIVLTYDPAVLTVGSLQNGSVFDRVIRQTVGNGKIVYSGAVSPEKKNMLKTGVVLTFSVTPKVMGTGTISFDRTKTITALNGGNTLGSTNELNVEVR